MAGRRSVGASGRRRWLGPLVAVTLLCALFGIASQAQASPSPAPPLDGCMANGTPFAAGDCFGLSGSLGSISSIVSHVVSIGTEVTMTTEPEDTTTPIQCGDLGCTYHSVTWKWDSFFQHGFAIVAGCATNDFSCTVRYDGQGSGDGAETWAPILVQHWAGAFPQGGVAHAFFAPPKLYPIEIHTQFSDGSDYDADEGSVALLVRQGFDPDVSACLARDWYVDSLFSATVPVPTCVVADEKWLGSGAEFDGMLPNDSGDWDIFTFDKPITNLTGKARALGKQFTDGEVTPNHDDLFVTVTYQARPQLDVTVTPRDATVEVGADVTVAVKVDAVDGDAGSIDGITFSRPSIFSDTALAYSVVGAPVPVPPAAGFSLADGESRTFEVTLHGVAQANVQTSASASGTTDQGFSRSSSDALTLHVVPSGSTSTTLPNGSAPTPPVITSAIDGIGAADGTIQGTVEGDPNGTRTVALATSGGATCTKLMSGAGTTTLGAKTVTLDGNGHGSFTFTGPLTVGAFVYGTASTGAAVSTVGDCATVTAPATTTTTTSSTTSTSTSSTTTTTTSPSSTTTTTTSPSSTSTAPTTSTTTASTTSTTRPPSTTTQPATTTTTTAPPSTIPPSPPATPVVGPSDDEAFVGKVFHDLLGRSPDAAALAYWAGRLDGGASDRSVVDAIVGSVEYRHRTVTATYLMLLGRKPDRRGLAHWTALLQGGGHEDLLRASLLGSDEAWRKAGSDPSAYADLIYRAILGRAPDPGGRAHVVAWLAAGRSRTVLVGWLVSTAEADRFLADHWYQVILGRHATADEQAVWVGALKAGTPESALVAALAAGA